MFIEGKPREVIFLQTLNLQLHPLRRMKKSNIRSLWIWPWGQLSIGERQATCRALGNWFNSKIIASVSVASVELSRFVTSELLIPSNEDKQEWSDGNWVQTGSNWSSKRKSNCPTGWVHLDYMNVYINLKVSGWFQFTIDCEMHVKHIKADFHTLSLCTSKNENETLASIAHKRGSQVSTAVISSLLIVQSWPILNLDGTSLQMGWSAYQQW